MTLSEVLQARLQEKDLTAYAIAKLISEADSKGRPVTSFTSRVKKAIDDPDGRILSNIKQVVEALDGEIVIRWIITTESIL